MYGLYERGMPLTEISHHLNIPLTTIHSTVVRGDQDRKEKEGRGRYPKTSKAQDEAMVEEARKNRHTSHQDIDKKIAPDVSNKTIKRRRLGKSLEKWVAQERVHLDEEALARKRLK